MLYEVITEQVAERLGISVTDLNKLVSEVNLSSFVSLEDYLEQNYEVGLDLSDASYNFV